MHRKFKKIKKTFLFTKNFNFEILLFELPKFFYSTICKKNSIFFNPTLWYKNQMELSTKYIDKNDLLNFFYKNAQKIKQKCSIT